MKRIIIRFLKLFKKKKIVPIYISQDNSNCLKNKIAIVTGGTGGIGFSISQKLLLAGCNVIVIGTNYEKFKKNFKLLDCDRIKFLSLDLCDVKSFEKIINEAAKSFNNESHLSILINCAGVNEQKNFFDVNEDEFVKTMDINVKGAFFMSKYFSKYLIENNIRGHILNISSASGLRPASTPYALSKWAINGMTKGMADILLPYGIIVNGLAPGPTATEMISKSCEDISSETSPAGRCSTPEEIADLALFMVSDRGDMIVGDTFYITGGSGTISLHK